MKKKTEVKPYYDRINLLEFQQKETVYLTLGMLCTHARMKGTIYFQFIEGGTKYKLQVLEEDNL